MLVVKDLVAGYPKKSGIVVHGVSLNIEKSQIVSLIGHNGSGKTTILKSIIGDVKPESGSVQFMGNDITNLPIHKTIPLGISMIIEYLYVFPKKKIYDNLIMGASIIKDKEFIAKRIEEVYEIFPTLKDFTKEKVRAIPPAEKQMVSIARALMSNPKLLILDEINLSVLSNSLEQAFEYIKKIRDLGISVIIVEQDIGKVLPLIDYAYVIAGGRVVMEGTGSELSENDQLKQFYMNLM